MAKQTKIVEVNSVMVELPIGELPESGYEVQCAHSGSVDLTSRGVHVDAQLGQEAAEAFLKVRNGLRNASAKLATGRPVWSNADALRWMMEQVAAG